MSKPISKYRPVLRLATLSAALSSVFWMTGCSFIPTYERPAAPVAPSFTEAKAKTETPAETRSAADIEWKSFFKDARLQRLIQLALDNNRDLRVAILNIEKSRASMQLARADEFPTVNAGITGSRGPSSSANGAIVSSYTAGLSVSAYELDFFGRLRALTKAAQAQLLSTVEARKTTQISLIASVATNYLSLLSDDEQIRVTRDTIASLQESLRLTQLKYDHESASKLDVSTAQSSLESAKVSLAQLVRQRAQDETALVLLLGQPMPTDLPSGKPLDEQEFLEDLPAGVPSELLVRRPDVVEAEQNLIALNANIGAARAAFFPQITLTASAGVASSDLGMLFSPGTPSAWSFAPQLLVPIFDAGKNKANLETAKVNKDIAIAQYEKAIQTGFKEVADALAGRATLNDQLKAQADQLAALKTTMDLTELRYKNGVSSSFDMLDAQRSLLSAQQSLVQVKAQRLENLVTLYKVLGGGWTEPSKSQN